ncbi:hypothetical protein JOM56_005531 [Amanita muscaria]
MDILNHMLNVQDSKQTNTQVTQRLTAPEHVSFSATLTLIASLALRCPEIRRNVTDKRNLLPFINLSQYHACQCIRALSRLVQALTTNLVDSGVVLDIIMTARESPEGRRTVAEAGTYDKRSMRLQRPLSRRNIRPSDVQAAQALCEARVSWPYQ